MTSSISDTSLTTETPLPRVLLVDDEPAILDGLCRQLRGRFDISTAVGAEEALRFMAVAEPFAVVLSDMRMPNMGGVEFLAIVREKYPDTARLMLTGQADIESMIDAINLGQITRFLVKPCPWGTVEAALHDAAELHQKISAERDLLRTAKAVVHALDDPHRATGRHPEPVSVQRPLTPKPHATTRHRTLAERLAVARFGPGAPSATRR